MPEDGDPAVLEEEGPAVLGLVKVAAVVVVVLFHGKDGGRLHHRGMPVRLCFVSVDASVS